MDTVSSPESNGASADAARNDAQQQQQIQQRGPLPSHVAAIMDGNGRWAQQRDQARFMGHHEGVESVRDIAEAAAELGIDYLTLYTFSTENWERPQREVNALMELLVHTVQREQETLMRNDIRLRTIGDLSQLPPACQEALDETKAATAGNARMTLTLALSYSGRWDLTQATRSIARAVQDGTLSPDAIDESTIEQHLSTAALPDPDLLIRTGGEYRLSNFLLWQGAYTELYITERYWPDFRRAALYDAVRSFQDRDRRYGRVSLESSTA
ncbi:isoprenyl transferase [Salisaeta longa]|uniref:isoprenyl transferase n=1 Tax=Salisaeta longa TaxID=503170 RepID=UPI0003B5FD83|nr:isoprenyl transferase [Salisaeta longa]